MSQKTFSSGEVMVSKPVSEVFRFVSDFNNFNALLPPQVSNYSSTSDRCSFTLEGMPSLGLVIRERITDSLVVIVPDGDIPIDFEMRCRMQAADAESCTVEISIAAKLNPVMAMMLSRPLENLVKMMGEKLGQMPAMNA